MCKRKYTHIQELEEEILRMRQEGATRQEIANQFGLSKSQIKNWITRYNRRQAKLAAGIQPRPKEGREKMPHQKTLWQSRRMRSSACRWRTNCCGIFCDPLEGGEARSKIPHYIPPQEGIPNIRDVCVFCSIQKRILRLCPSPRQTEEGCCSCGAHCTAAGTQLPYLRLPTDMVVAQEPKYLPQPKNGTADYEAL